MAKISVTYVFISFILLSTNDSTASMDCDVGHESSWFDKFDGNVKSCPDNQYCCLEDNHMYCCTREEFVSNSVGVLLPILVAVAIGFLITCCVCCLCCPCCLLYKRRHHGTVYGRVQTVLATPQQAPAYAPQPTSVTVPMPTPGYSQTGYPLYPSQAGQQPPPYSEVGASELYSKQAPYNPSFQ